ncbi:guanylate kinase [Candidatus Gromoviella agglomerans]|uniref:guanylate kinase n=1 Tax=Candidatus Gromoviella agglomerans TaxID=2806609 RepID=UPI001E39F644|nr:AAA family ATPase [Candidatus Gromoviella agglomerans]UFX98427.1 Guanylate kinase [Candidatus Gromoviella agglomerans]
MVKKYIHLSVICLIFSSLKLNSSKIVVISGASGCGKSSIIKHLLKRNENTCFSVSYTTRSSRANEVDGIDYFFVSDETMTSMIKNNQIVEYTKNFGNTYGTSAINIHQAISKGMNIICDVDESGAKKISEFAHMQNIECITIWIDVNKDEIIDRIKKRGYDVERRSSSILDDYSSVNEKYDFLVKNENVLEAVMIIEKIINQNLHESKSITKSQT